MSPNSAGPPRLLVFGGTGFVSRAVAAEAVARGYDVTCVARGTGGSPPEGARLLRADRDHPDALAPLRGTRFDAAVETATLSLPWVRRALREVTADHWTFVSSISVYADTRTRGQTLATAPLRPALCEDGTAYDPATDPEPSQAHYGGVKLACEQAVREATGDTAFVVRPGLVVGPGDDVGPFGYWPLRMARGRTAAVPAGDGADGLPLPAQCVDVRDLAAWILDQAGARATGVHDAAGPPVPLASLLREVSDAVGHDSLELLPVTEDMLREAGVRTWTGPRSMPLWPGPELYGALSRDVTTAFAAGLRIRPVAETAEAVLRDRLGRGANTPPVAGLTPVEEASLLRLATG